MHHAEVIFQNNTIQIGEYNPRLKKKTITVLEPKDLAVLQLPGSIRQVINGGRIYDGT